MNRYMLTNKVAVLGIGANILLAVSKLAVGFLYNSQAMLADGFNSAQDVFTSGLTFIGNKIASKPEDKNHPYGHGKAEYIFSMIISLSLLLVGIQVFRSSLDSILNRREFTFSWLLVLVALGTILVKTCLYIYSKRAESMEESLLLTASVIDHRNDIFITIATLAGILAGTAGVYWLDGVVGIGISIWIIISGLKIFTGAYSVLMDTSIDSVMLSQLRSIIEEVSGVEYVDSIKSKPIGVGHILIVKVSVEADMTVKQGHSIAARVKEDLVNCRVCRDIDDVVVHVNPA